MISKTMKEHFQSLQKLFLNIIKSVGEQFFIRFSKFRKLEDSKFYEVSRKHKNGETKPTKVFLDRHG